jgi:hypothetical protein
MKYVPLNFELMSHPLNWLIIGLMVMLATLGLSLVFPAAQPHSQQ